VIPVRLPRRACRCAAGSRRVGKPGLTDDGASCVERFWPRIFPVFQRELEVARKLRQLLLRGEEAGLLVEAADRLGRADCSCLVARDRLRVESVRDERAVPVALVEAEDLLGGGETLCEIAAVAMTPTVGAEEGVDDQVIAGGSEGGDAVVIGGEVERVVDVGRIEIRPVLDTDPLASDVLERAALVEEIVEELPVAVGLSVAVRDLGEEPVDLRDRPQSRSADLSSYSPRLE